MLKNLVKEKYPHPEEQYTQLIKELLSEANLETGRNGNVYRNIGAAMYFSLENNKIPILTTKKVAIKTCLKELLWFIRGNTDNNLLRRQGVNIWNANASDKFLKSRNLSYEQDD